MTTPGSKRCISVTTTLGYQLVCSNTFLWYAEAFTQCVVAVVSMAIALRTGYNFTFSAVFPRCFVCLKPNESQLVHSTLLSLQFIMCIVNCMRYASSQGSSQPSNIKGITRPKEAKTLAYVFATRISHFARLYYSIVSSHSVYSFLILFQSVCMSNKNTHLELM